VVSFNFALKRVLRVFSAAPGRGDEVPVMGENPGAEDYSEERSRVMARAR
jgi:hypothetical protein